MAWIGFARPSTGGIPETELTTVGFFMGLMDVNGKI
jgi:hypothetical protein